MRLTKGFQAFIWSVFIVFVILWASNVIHWSWLWITAPLWIGYAYIGIYYFAWRRWDKGKTKKEPPQRAASNE